MYTPRLDRIPVQEVLRYLGCPNWDVPEEQEALIRSCAEELLMLARPRMVCRAFPLSRGRLVGAALTLEGEDIRRHLEGCELGILMAVTLGPDVETLLLRTEVTNLARAVVLDSAASAAVENVCDNLEEDLRRDYLARGLFLTDRFSPGYGDLPLSLQGPLCEVLDTRRRMGLAVSASGILIPRKSVTALLGAASTPRVRHFSGCAGCPRFSTCDRKRCERSPRLPEQS